MLDLLQVVKSSRGLSVKDMTSRLAGELLTRPKIYGCHVDPSVSDLAQAVTYLADAVGMTPAMPAASTIIGCPSKLRLCCSTSSSQIGSEIIVIIISSRRLFRWLSGLLSRSVFSLRSTLFPFLDLHILLPCPLSEDSRPCERPNIIIYTINTACFQVATLKNLHRFHWLICASDREYVALNYMTNFQTAGPAGRRKRGQKTARLRDSEGGGDITV